MSEYIFKLPDLGEGTVESEIAEWLVKVGDEVEEEAVVAVMLTDKAAVELSSPVAGRVVALGGEPGDMVPVGARLVVFETSAEVPAEQATAVETAAPAAENAAPAPVKAAVADADKRIITSPSIRRKAKEAGIDLALVEASGADGRILAADLERHLQNRDKPAAAALSEPGSSAVTEIKVIGLRRMIAQRMAESKREIPHFSYVEELDITELESLRQHMNSKRADPAQRLTLLPFVALALVKVLREFPQCNTTYDKERNLLLQHQAMHIGIATQTPDGLKVPCARHCENRSIDGLAAEIRRLSEAARNNTATKEELSGSTITITSLGKLGGIASTPVINMPEVAIIGVNKAVERPVVVNGQIGIRLMMNLSSSFDHRFVDGYDAAAMIQRMKEFLEHPATLFMP